jgi:hypothetical protein
MACSIALSSVERIYVHVGTRSPAMAEWKGLPNSGEQECGVLNQEASWTAASSCQFWGTIRLQK